MMMRTFYVILVSAVCTLTLRALPFVLFRKDKAMPAWLSRLGEALPSAIMAVLVVYCLRIFPRSPSRQVCRSCWVWLSLRLPIAGSATRC